MAFAAIFKNILNLIYPLHCAVCKKRLEPSNISGVCGLCLDKAKRSAGAHFRRAGHFSVYSAAVYEGTIKDLIHRFKYEGKPSLGHTLSKIMLDGALENKGALEGIDAVTFVPLHASRLRKRDYNQSGILADDISRILRVPLFDALVKVKATRPQNELPRTERLTNLKGAFRIRGGRDLSGLSILLIDDVMTTGATLEECAKTLIKAGAKEVRCFTLACGI